MIPMIPMTSSHTGTRWLDVLEIFAFSFSFVVVSGAFLVLALIIVSTRVVRFLSFWGVLTLITLDFWY